MTESGHRDHLLRTWEGSEIPQMTAAMEFTVLTAGQMIWGFAFFAGTFSCSMIVFCFEIGRKKFSDFQEKKEQKRLGVIHKLH